MHWRNSQTRSTWKSELCSYFPGHAFLYCLPALAQLAVSVAPHLLQDPEDTSDYAESQDRRIRIIKFPSMKINGRSKIKLGVYTFKASNLQVKFSYRHKTSLKENCIPSLCSEQPAYHMAKRSSLAIVRALWFQAPT